MSGFPPDSPVPPSEPPPPGGFPPFEPPSVGMPPSPPTLPWEDPAVGGPGGFFRTAWMFLTNPTEAYARMPTHAQLVKPLVYGILLAWAGAVAAGIYRVAVGNPLLRMLPQDMVPPQLQQQMTTTPLAMVVGLLLAPAFILIFMTVWSGILHVMLLMLGGANAGYAATLRVVCYAATANVLQLVPVCGGFVGALWGLVLEVVGLAAAHKTSTAKAALAVLIPLLLCCVCVTAVVAMFGAAIMALASGWR